MEFARSYFVLLYIIDRADSFAKLDCSINLYADDVKLCSSFKVKEYSSAMDEALEYVTIRVKIWQLLTDCQQ